MLHRKLLPSLLCRKHLINRLSLRRTRSLACWVHSADGEPALTRKSGLFLAQPAFEIDKRKATVFIAMKIGRIAHKGLRTLYEDDSTKAIPAGIADKLRKMLAFLKTWATRTN
jgi:hypothetical protein